MNTKQQTQLIEAINEVASYFGGNIRKSNTSGWVVMVSNSVTGRYSSLEKAANAITREVGEEIQSFPEGNTKTRYANAIARLNNLMNKIGRKGANPNNPIEAAKTKLFTKYGVDNLSQLRVIIPEAKKLDMRFKHNWDYLVLHY